MSDYFDTYKKRLEASRPPFERMVDKDISRCEEYLSGDRDESTGKELHFELITKYPPHIAHFGDALYNFNAEQGLFMEEYFDANSMISNVTAIKHKLTAFKANGYKNSSQSKKSSSVNIENTLIATQTQSITVSFDKVRNQIKEMSGLSDADTKETLDKIDELKVIVESSESKKTKWQKVKPILAWIADKSVDVGIALLPLILKIGGTA